MAISFVRRVIARVFHRDVPRATSHELRYLKRVGSPPGRRTPHVSVVAIAVCSCELWLVATTDAAAEHAHDRHQAEPAQAWIR